MAKSKFSTKKIKVITSLRHLVDSNAQVYGDRVQYYYKEGKEEKQFTFCDMQTYMNQLGTFFCDMGWKGKRIAVTGDTHPLYIAVYFAAVNSGNVIVPLDKELEEEQIVNFLNRAEVSALFYTSKFNGRMTAMAAQVPTLEYLVPLQGEEETLDAPTHHSLEDVLNRGKTLLENGDRKFLDYQPEMDTMCALLFTSGTTGTSKGVMLSQGNLTSCCNACVQSMACDETNTFVSVLPIHHTYESTISHLAASNVGATTYINESIRTAARTFKTFQPNTLILVPLFLETIYKKIWTEIKRKKMEKKVRFGMKLSNFLMKLGIDRREKIFAELRASLDPNLTSVVCGSAPISKEVLKDFYTWGIDVLEGYGITECSPLISVNRPNKIRYGSVGQPVDAVTVQIDVAGGKGSPENTGEILVKGPNVMLGYYKDEEATAAAFTPDGYFRTGDLGYLDKDNYLFITGRKKNLILGSNGKNIFPEEIEEHLSHCELIEESVVVGRTGQNGELVLTALIYPNQELTVGQDGDAILAKLKEEIHTINQKLPVYKQIRDIELRKEPFEKTTTRKIKRYLVK